MFYHTQWSILSGCVVLMLCASVASAVMPPDTYARKAEESAIKAIAVVSKVEILTETEQYTEKRITFSLEYALTEEISTVFTGTCASVDHAWQEPGEGGTVYIYPVKGERVYVTVSSDDGLITSYTLLTPELERAVREAPETLHYGFSEVWVDE